MVKTFRDKLQDFSSEIKDDLEKLLLEYSALIYDDLNAGSTVCIMVIGDYRWQELSLEGKRLQSKVRADYDKYKTIIESLVSNVNHKKLDKKNKVINNVIEQSHRSYIKNTEQAFEKAVDAFSKIDSLLDSLHSSSQSCLLVVDTNSLLINPRIEKWSFDEVDDFVIVLTPTVLSELDGLKVNHRNEAVREKSKRLIRQIKEYRRRGSLISGVKISGDNITLKSIAVEPDFQNTLPWLDKENNDDRFIASVYEIIKENIRSSVYVITTDINMQNKAEFSYLPFLEPPQD